MGWQDDEVISGGSGPAPGTAAARAAWEQDEVIGGRDPGGLTINMTRQSGGGDGRVPSAGDASAPKEVPDAARPLVGFNRTVADMAGAPVDAMNAVVRGAGAEGSPTTAVLNSIMSPKAQELRRRAYGETPMAEPFGGAGTVKKGMGLVGANPDDVRPAETAGERILEGAGSGVAAMLVPGLGAEALLARATSVDGAIMGALQMVRGTGAASNAAIGAAGGAVGEVAAEAVPDDASLSVGPVDFSAGALKDAARLGGNIAGGGVAAGLQSGVEAGARTVGNAVRAATEPVELRAARSILGRSEDPAALRMAAERAAEAPPIVNGSNPTLFQATGDLGVGGLEREVAASPKGVPRFAGVREEQNSARLAELDRLQKALPENADPANTASYVQKRVQELEQSFGERVTAARNELDERFKTDLLNEAEYGAALREAPIRLRAELEKAEDALWAAVDPDRVAPFNPATLKGGVDAIEKSIPRTAKAAEGEERALFDVFKALDDSTTFGDITALRSRLTDELREATNTPTVRRRISLMLKEVDNALGETGASAPDVLDRYAAARAATRDVKSRFGDGAVGRIMKEGDNDGFRTTASNVAKNIFDRPEDLRAYLGAVGDDAAARAQLQDYAAFSLHKDAVRDGMMSPAKYQKWLADHDYVMKEFPALRERFGNIQSAQTALDDALAAQKQALADYQTATIKRLLKTEDPEQVIAKALSAPGEFTILAKEAANDPAATAGMKRAVVDFMMKQAKSTAEAGTSGETQINAATLQKFFLNNKRSLSALFSPEEMASIERVTMDLQRANRSNVAVKIPVGSNTTQDMGGRSFFETAIRSRGGRIAGALMDPTGGVAGYAVGGLVDALRVARATKIEDALVEMMLNPKIAAEWLRKVPAKDGAATASSFARRLKALTAAQVTEAFDEDSKRP